jgi:hypothetical protein
MADRPITWLRTPAAARALSVRPETLKRIWAHPQEGFLKEGVHWRRGGPHPNSSRAWNLEACLAAKAAQGYVDFAPQVDR